MGARPVADGLRDATALARRFGQAGQRYGPVPTSWRSGERLD
jgi:hypothetical protein